MMKNGGPVDWSEGDEVHGNECVNMRPCSGERIEKCNCASKCIVTIKLDAWGNCKESMKR
jgi:hypothetical protein